MTVGVNITYEVSRKPHYINHAIYYRDRRAVSVFVDLRRQQRGHADIWLDACWRSEYSLSREGKAKVLGILQSARERMPLPYRRPWSEHIITAGVWRVPAGAAPEIASRMAAILLDPRNLKETRGIPLRVVR